MNWKKILLAVVKFLLTILAVIIFSYIYLILCGVLERFNWLYGLLVQLVVSLFILYLMVILFLKFFNLIWYRKKTALVERFTSSIKNRHGDSKTREEASKRKDYLHLRELISKDEVLLLVHKKYSGIRKLLIYSLCGISLKYFDKAYKTGKVAIEIGENGPRIGTPIPWQKALSESANEMEGVKYKV